MMRTADRLAIVVLSLFLTASFALGQGTVVVGNQQSVGGVYIDAEGIVKLRQADPSADLAGQRLRAKALNQPLKSQPFTAVSLPRLIAQVRAAQEAGKELPDDVRYLSGLTQIRYVFVFPEDKDLVIAGPSEPFEAANRLQPFGKLTGRPVLQLDDLAVALRLATNPPRGGLQPFGCSIDPHPDSLNRSSNVMRQQASSSRAERMQALKDALGPQQVNLFGAPADTRFAFVTLAADYRLKRMCLGLDAPPVAGIGSAIDNSRAAGNRFWFEASYAPLLVSPAGDAFEIRGPRLMLKCGALSFDEKGATDTAKAFARRFTEKFPQLATTVPAFADLQNIADLAMVAALIRSDRLDQKAGVELSYLVGGSYKVAPFATPKSAETLVNYTSGSIVAGGVSLNLAPALEQAQRETDAKETLKPVRVRPSSDNWCHTKG